MKDKIVASGLSHVTQRPLNRQAGIFSDNYNKDSYLNEADMNS